MFRVTDLKSISIATPDLEGAVATLRKNFSFPVRPAIVVDHEPKMRRAFLGVGPAEIEVVTPHAQGSPLSRFIDERGAGLFELVLEVDDLEAARGELSERGIEVTLSPGIGSERRANLNPTQTHGVRIALVGR